MDNNQMPKKQRSCMLGCVVGFLLGVGFACIVLFLSIEMLDGLDSCTESTQKVILNNVAESSRQNHGNGLSKTREKSVSEDPFDVIKETALALLNSDIEVVFENYIIPDDCQVDFSKLSQIEKKYILDEVNKGITDSLAKTNQQGVDLKALFIDAIQRMIEKERVVENNQARITILLTMFGEENEFVVELVKLDGRWKIKYLECVRGSMA